jgi:LuxR family maltose regulon positive regulatory protein
MLIRSWENTSARTLLDSARDVQGVHESAFNAMFSESVEGIIDLQEGRQRQAAARFRLAAGITRPQSAFSPVGTNGNARAGVLHACTVYESNDLDTAAQLLTVYAPLARHIGLPDHMIMADIMLARIAFIKGDVDKALQTLTLLERTGHNRQLPRVVATSRLHRAQIMLLQGNDHAARTEIERASDPATWARLRHLRLLANDVDNDRIGRLRWEAFVGDTDLALRELLTYIAESRAETRHRRAFKLCLLQAVAQQRAGDLPAALKTLEQALKEGSRAGYMRLVVDEGPRVGALVVRLQSDSLERKRDRREPLFAEYLQSLLQGFGAHMFNEYSIADDPNATLPEPLTRKEIGVLKLLAQGNSNSAMAAKLFVSDSTIRTHLRNINGKLNASNRTEAVAIARRVGVV